MKQLYYFFVILICYTGTCSADVLFIHDYKTNEYVIGEQDAELAVGFTADAMYINMETRYTGSWMKRFFGGVKQQRETTHFLLDKNEIREVEWQKNQVIVYPFAMIADRTWLKEKAHRFEGAEEIIKSRYRVLDPQFSIDILSEKEIIGAYTCKNIEVKLRLETLDIKKKASSITLINQKLWISEQVAGFEEYSIFHQKLAQKIGLDAYRLGNLNFLLQYWQGSLEPIYDLLEKIKGYPIKNIVTVTAQYVTETNTTSPKTISKQIKEELMMLKNVVPGLLDKTRFQTPAEFRELTIKSKY